MAKPVILLIFFVSVGILHAGKLAFNWFINNPGLYTESFGFMPWLLIVCAFFLTPHILKRLKQ